jgi:hypothetical protein
VINIFISKTVIFWHLFFCFFNWPNFWEEVVEKLCKDLVTVFAGQAKYSDLFFSDEAFPTIAVLSEEVRNSTQYVTTIPGI